MKVKIELHEGEIECIIAEKYGVKPSDVFVTTERTWVGHGPTEQEDHIVKARVELQGERVIVK